MFSSPLDGIRVASPCSADWEGMFGDERRRFCSECSRNVYNLSSMTKAEVEKLVLDAEGRLCVQFFRRADGSVLTADCPVGLARVRRRLAKVATAVASIVFGFAGGVFGIRAAEGVLSILPVGDVPVVPIKSDLELIESEIVVGQATFEERYIPVRGEMIMGKPVIEPLTKKERR